MGRLRRCDWSWDLACVRRPEPLKFRVFNIVMGSAEVEKHTPSSGDGLNGVDRHRSKDKDHHSHKHKHKDKERKHDKEKQREKEKAKEKEKEKEKEKTKEKE